MPLLLATTALIGISTLPSIAFADVVDDAMLAVNSPLIAGDENKDLNITGAGETIFIDNNRTVGETAVDPDAINTLFNTGPSSLSILQSAVAMPQTLQVIGNINAATGQDLNLTIAAIGGFGAANSDIIVDVTGDLNLGEGFITIISNNTIADKDASLLVSGDITTGGITLVGNSATAVAQIDLGGTTSIVNSLATTSNTIINNNGNLTAGTYGITAGSILNNSGTINISNPAASASFNGTVDLSSVALQTGTLNLGDGFINATTVFTGTTLNMTGNVAVIPDVAFGSGTVVLVDNLVGNADENVANINADNLFRNFTVAVNGTNVEITAGAAKPTTQIATTLGVSTTDAGKIIQLTSGATLPATVQTAINTAVAGTPSQIQEAVGKLGDANVVAGAINNAATEVFHVTTTSIANRLASLRGGSLGVSAGDITANNKMWFQGTASTLDQGARKGIAGYEANSIGGTIGYDNEVTTGTRAGLAFSYNYADINGESFANSDAKVNTYILALYGDKTIDDSFITGSVHFGINDVNTAQNVLGFGRMSGDYSTNQYGADIKFGKKFNVANTTYIIPEAGLNYTHITKDKVTLRDNVNTVQDLISSKNSLVGKIGARLEGSYKYNMNTYRPEIHANLMYDFASDEVQSTRAFGGGAFVSDQQVQIAEESLNLGTSFTFESANKMITLQFGYDAQIKDEFLSHTGQVKASFKF